MNQTATVHARVDQKTKKKSESILRQMGMTPTDAVRMLYRQIVLRNGFPLELKVPNAVTASTLKKSEKGEEIESFKDLGEMFSSWRKE
jgi:DNA-damage-inducible protein J